MMDSQRRERNGDLKQSGKTFGNPDLNMGEASTSVALTSSMTAVVLFFIGLLLTGSPAVQIRLRLPLFFLFVSALGFLYSTLVYANATGEIARLSRRSFERQMSIGNILSEYLGVYGLVFAIPLVVLGYSPDRVLPQMVLIVSVTGFLLYHCLGYSILERYVGRVSFYSFIFVALGLHVGSFLSLYWDHTGAYYVQALGLLSLIMIVTVVSLRRREEEEDGACQSPGHGEDA